MFIPGAVAAEVIRYAPDGSVDRVVEMPVKKVTSVVFGGLDLDILFVNLNDQATSPMLPG